MITDDKNQSEYNLKYIDLREKHAQFLYDSIDRARDIAVELTTKVVPEELFQLIDETQKLKKWIKSQTKLFYKTEEYTTEQKKLTMLKEKLSSCDESEKEEIQKQIAKAMASVVTLNITIKNRLKEQNDKLKLNEDYIDEQIALLDDELKKIKGEVMEFLRGKLAICIKEYNEELNSLRESYGLSRLEEAELPIDKNLINLDIPIFSLKSEYSKKQDKVETVVDKSEADNCAEYSTKTFIVSENTSDIKN